ncbi:hypothetical protein TBR22_A32040 [Luteitalea sp. TBR-22]|uniref:hypothetical protein n=1 Tax=Luteitalea sp. TBR-22 TaxID=2802971 RepID=UPI001AF10A4D|nr:hypothetical protein [Luteitalea sp. TBR-22]BCS33975.1 hypothetical protein TBR22_A32040 [Luteitalea sp. TBR-22]
MRDTPTGPARPFDPSIGKRTQFQKGNTASLKTGAYAGLLRARDRQREALLMKAGVTQALADACVDMEAELQRRQGFEVTLAQRGLVRRFCELDGLVACMFDKLMDGAGPLTATGKTKRCLDSYIRLTERQTRIAQALGLPKAGRDALPRRPVLPSLADYRAPDPEDA